MTTLPVLAILGALVLHLASAWLVARRYRAPAPRVAPGDMPRVTLLRPVRGLEYGLEQTLESGFRQDAPGYDLIHCIEDADDPAIPVLRRLMQAHPQVPAQLLIGRDVISGNPKLNNLVKGWVAAGGEWVVMADSNLLLPPDYLRQVLAGRGPGVGMVSSPGVGVQPEGLWARVEAGFLNTFQARWMLAGDGVGIGYAQGKTLAYPRDWLNAQGGIAALACDLAEDIASSHLMRSRGLRVRLVPRPFAQPLGRRAFATVWGRQARWARLRREGVTPIYALEPLGNPVVITLLLALIWPAAVPALLIVWYGTEWLLARRAGWPSGSADIAAWLLRDLLQLPLWVSGWRGAPIVWRGNQVTATPAADGKGSG